MRQNIAIFLVLISQLAQAQAQYDPSSYRCNCTDCFTPVPHPIGSETWCRCCENAVVPTCGRNTTCNYFCHYSSYEATQCLANGYLTQYCQLGDGMRNDDDQTVSPFGSERSDQNIFFARIYVDAGNGKSSIAYTMPLIEPPGEYDRHHCNCTGCDALEFEKDSDDWCRCCQNALVPTCASGSSLNVQCRQSVFNARNCIDAGYLTSYCVPDEYVNGFRVPRNSQV